MTVSRKIAGCKISDGIPFADTESELRDETNYENGFFKAVDEIANDYELDFSPEHDIPQPSRLPKFTKNTKVGFQGVEGSFGHAAMQEFFGREVSSMAYVQFEDVFRRLKSDEIDYGILPIENSTTGPVNDVYDLLGKYGFYIVGQLRLPVSQNLLVIPGTKIEEIEKVYSHPQGLMQSREFLARYPHIKQITFSNTAAAAKMVAESGDRSKASISSPVAAEIYGLEILKADIHTEKSNTTRFVIIGKKFEAQKSADCISIFLTAKHQPGSLATALEIIKDAGLNMINLQSRPIKNVNWEYSFYIDFEGRLSDKNVIRALTKLTNRSSRLKILGTFDRDN